MKRLSLPIKRISRIQAVLLAAIVLLLVVNGYIYQNYRQESQKQAKLQTQYASASQQAERARSQFQGYSITRPEDVVPLLNNALASQQEELVRASETYFPQTIREWDITNLIVGSKGGEVILKKLEPLQPVKQTVGKSEYRAFRYAINASGGIDQLKEWLRSIEESALFSSLYIGDITISKPSSTWDAAFTVTVIAQ